MRASTIAALEQGADILLRARMSTLLVELAMTKRQPTADERTFLEDNVPLMQSVAQEITRHAPEEAAPSDADHPGEHPVPGSSV